MSNLIIPAAASASNDGVMFQGANEHTLSLGSPAQAYEKSFVPVWQFLDSASGGVGSSVRIPTGWASMKVELLVTSSAAGDGTKFQRCRLDYTATALIDGAVLPAITNGGNVDVISATTAFTIQAVQVLATVNVTAGAFFSYRAVFLNTATQPARDYLGARFTKLT